MPRRATRSNTAQRTRERIANLGRRTLEPQAILQVRAVAQHAEVDERRRLVRRSGRGRGAGEVYPQEVDGFELGNAEGDEREENRGGGDGGDAEDLVAAHGV